MPRVGHKLCSEMPSVTEQEVMAINYPNTSSTSAWGTSFHGGSTGTAAQGRPGVPLSGNTPNPSGCAPVGRDRGSPEVPPNPKDPVILWIKPLQLWKFIAGIGTRPSCLLQNVTNSQHKARVNGWETGWESWGCEKALERPQNSSQGPKGSSSKGIHCSRKGWKTPAHYHSKSCYRQW